MRWMPWMASGEGEDCGAGLFLRGSLDERNYGYGNQNAIVGFFGCCFESF